jgi:hypothetical protein
LKGPAIQKQQKARQGDDHGLGHESKNKKQANQEVSRDGLPMQVDPICPDSQKEKECRENGLALGNPSDGFDVKRMYCEQEGYQDTAAEVVGGRIEKQKKENHTAGVKKDAREMMTGRLAAERGDISHMREPGERMPVCLGSGCECPAHV